MLNTLKSDALLARTKTLVANERRITLELVDHLREIERRLLFADLGYSSLFDFCVKHLGLSEGSAQRRIAAMRLIRELPEAKPALENGNLSLSNAAKLQSTFRAAKIASAPVSPESKREILKEVSGLSQRDCEAKLFELVPDASIIALGERTRAIGVDQFELKLVIDGKLREKLDRLKELLAHRVRGGGTVEILEYLCEHEVARLEKEKGLRGGPRTQATAAAVRTEKFRSVNPDAESPLPPAATIRQKSIPRRTRREIWGRAGGRCEYIVHSTGSRCGGRFQLEIDHIIPRAFGGGHETENLRLLCRMHNLQQARMILGEDTLGKYVPSLRNG